MSVSMTSIRNLPLAARLGGAFGALCLMLAIVAFTGVHSMNGVRDDSANLAKRDLRIAELIGGDPAARQGQHEPGRAAPVRLRRRPRRPGQGRGPAKANWAANKAASPKLAAARRRHGRSPSEFAEYAKLRDTFVDAQKRAVALSRTETVQNVEERDGSRDIFTGELLKADAAFDAGRRQADRRSSKTAAASVAEAEATASSGTRLILIITLLALLRRDRAGHLGRALGHAPGQGARRPA